MGCAASALQCAVPPYIRLPVASLFKPLTNVRIYAIIRSEIDRVSLMQMIVGTDNGKETGHRAGGRSPSCALRL